MTILLEIFTFNAWHYYTLTLCHVINGFSNLKINLFLKKPVSKIIAAFFFLHKFSSYFISNHSLSVLPYRSNI